MPILLFFKNQQWILVAWRALSGQELLWSKDLHVTTRHHQSEDWADMLGWFPYELMVDLTDYEVWTKKVSGSVHPCPIWYSVL
jgi:hypothetical protein